MRAGGGVWECRHGECARWKKPLSWVSLCLGNDARKYSRSGNHNEFAPFPPKKITRRPPFPQKKITRRPPFPHKKNHAAPAVPAKKITRRRVPTRQRNCSRRKTRRRTRRPPKIVPARATQTNNTCFGHMLERVGVDAFVKMHMMARLFSCSHSAISAFVKFQVDGDARALQAEIDSMEPCDRGPTLEKLCSVYERAICEASLFVHLLLSDLEDRVQSD